MNRTCVNVSAWVSVLLLVPGFLFAFPGDSMVSQPAHDGQPVGDTPVGDTPVGDALIGDTPVENPPGIAGPAGSAPRIIQYFEAYSITAGVELSWSAISEKDIRGFSIYRRDQDEYDFLLVNQEGLIGPWSKTYVDGDVQPATTYQYALSVVHTDGSDVFSDPARVTTRRTRPVKPRFLARIER